jgi:CMP-N,N'-diacetyllegionaminic acid synthase
MKIYIDIDETICNTPPDRNYANALPIVENIIKANKLYDAGHQITYWTARGTMTQINWTDITLAQFKQWGVKYHDLLFGKPAYDLFIDDKVMNTLDWNNDTINIS